MVLERRWNERYLLIPISNLSARFQSCCKYKLGYLIAEAAIISWIFLTDFRAFNLTAEWGDWLCVNSQSGLKAPVQYKRWWSQVLYSMTNNMSHTYDQDASKLVVLYMWYIYTQCHSLGDYTAICDTEYYVLSSVDSRSTVQ